MYKFTIFFTIAVACAMGAPANPSLEEIRKLPALDHEEVHDELGQYSLRYVTAEGTIVIEKGYLIPNPNGEGMVMVVEGQVTYVGDDGQIYTSKYSAGVDGVKVEALHRPVAPLSPVVEALPVPVPATVPLAAVVGVSGVPVALAPAVEVAAEPTVEIEAEPSVEIEAVSSVEIAAVPASPVIEVAAIPAAPLLPPLSVPILSLPVESEVTVTAV